MERIRLSTDTDVIAHFNSQYIQFLATRSISLIHIRESIIWLSSNSRRSSSRGRSSFYSIVVSNTRILGREFIHHDHWVSLKLSARVLGNLVMMFNYRDRQPLRMLLSVQVQLTPTQFMLSAISLKTENQRTELVVVDAVVQVLLVGFYICWPPSLPCYLSVLTLPCTIWAHDWTVWTLPNLQSSNTLGFLHPRASLKEDS